MRINDAILGLILVVVAGAILVHIAGFPTLPGQPYGPATFPRIVAIMMLVSGLLLVIGGYRDRLATGYVQVESWMRQPQALLKMACVPTFIVLYALFSPAVGFPILAAGLLFAFVYILSRRLLTAALTAVVASAAMWFGFSEVLGVPLPLGLLQDVVY